MTTKHDRVLVYDTTLRDGEQSPGASMTPSEKLAIAHQLARLRVDVIEAGFPAASEGDRQAVVDIAREVREPVISALARTHQADIEIAWNAIQHAAKPRLHTFIATSALHMQHKLRLEPHQVLDQASKMVEFASERCADVQFSAEDATRSDRQFLTEVLLAAIEAGATTINIPDTVGYCTPEDYGALLQTLMENIRVPGIVWSVHCHDDLGLATANSLAGLRAGAQQVEVTINGIGERAGIAPLEEVIMALAVRRDLGLPSSRVNTHELCSASRLVSRTTGFPVPPNKAVVGANAFAHAAGVHQHGMLQHAGTYEIMRPQQVGHSGSDLVLSKHSGRHAFRQRIEALGLALTDDELEAAFSSFKAVADQQKSVSDEELIALAEPPTPGGRAAMS